MGFKFRSASLCEFTVVEKLINVAEDGELIWMYYRLMQPD